MTTPVRRKVQKNYVDRLQVPLTTGEQAWLRCVEYHIQREMDPMTATYANDPVVHNELARLYDAMSNEEQNQASVLVQGVWAHWRMLCQICGEPRRHHVDGVKCLFDTTEFAE